MKKISAFLCLLFLIAANIYATERYSNIPMFSSSEQKVPISVQVSQEDFNKPIRYMTIDEYNGTTPIYLKLYQEIIIPITVTINSNNFIAGSGEPYHIECNNNMLRTEVSSSINISNNITINVLICCTSLSLGETTLTFKCTQNGVNITKQFIINIINSL